MTFLDSPSMAVDQMVRERRAKGERVLHLGFGEAGLPVLPAAAAALTEGARHNSYGPVAGSPAARAAVAGYWGRRHLPTDPESVVLAPGSKAILFGLLTVIPGDVILPKPSWVSYAAQAAIAGRQVLWVPAPEAAGGIPDPRLLEATILRAHGEGRWPGCLVMTLPDNPSGTLADEALVEAVCAVAEQYDIAVISDEIYRDLAYHPRHFHSPSHCLPEQTIVTSGLSKTMALGGWRIGAARFPDSPWGERTRRDFVGLGSEVWSALPGPMQTVATQLFSEPPQVREHVAASRHLHQAVAQQVHQIFLEAGAKCRAPQGAFYMYPDFGPLAAQLQTLGVNTADDLAAFLLNECGIAILSGVAFGDDQAGLRFRVATGLLYGETDDQRWEALRSASPAELPWIAESLRQLRLGLDPIRELAAEGAAGHVTRP